MTKDEIKRELDALGIDYPKDAKLGELEGLYAPFAQPDAATGDAAKGDDTTATPAAVSTGHDAAVAPAAEAPQGRPVDDITTPTTAPAETKTRTVTCSLLNLRDAANGAIVAIAREDAIVEVHGEVDDWTHVTLGAWVKSEFLG